MLSTTTTVMSTRRSPRDLLVDIGACVLLTVLGIAVTFRNDDPHTVGTLFFAAAASALVFARRRWAIPAAVVGLVSVVVTSVVTDRATLLLPTALILIFNVGARTDRRAAVGVAVLGVVSFLITVPLLESGGSIAPELLAAFAWPTLAAVAGDATRSRAQVLAAAIERAQHAEVTREQEARRRVAEERLHIARELHDLVAHNMAVVNVQAGVAEHFVRTDPDATVTALHHVRASAQTVLDELAGILSVLRSDGAPDAPAAPTPTIDDVPELVASFVDAGLAVTYESTGERRPLADAATLAAYRTVQEGLANAHKHGDGAARLCVAYAPDGLEVVVENRVAAVAGPDVPNWGYGLVGMRERVTAAGGSVRADGRGGTFRVEAHLPYTAAQT